MPQNIIPVYGKKARWELYQNATDCFIQILETTPHKKAAV